MNTVFNFGHPLSDEATAKLEQLIGKSMVITIPVQVDVQANVRHQMEDICAEAIGDDYWPTHLILPGLSRAAVAAANFFSTGGVPPAIIAVAAEPGSVPPRWMPVGVE